jgi:hypothetical protein
MVTDPRVAMEIPSRQKLLAVRRLSVVVFGPWLGACTPGDTNCPAYSVPGIVVEPSDARTGAPVGNDAVVTVSDGGYTESAPVVVGAAWDHPGTYSVSVRAHGYRNWTWNNVRVRQGRCQVKTVVLRARLEPV